VRVESCPGEREILLETQRERHHDVVVAPHRPSPVARRPQIPKSSRRDERGCMPYAALCSTANPCRASFADEGATARTGDGALAKSSNGRPARRVSGGRDQERWRPPRSRGTARKALDRHRRHARTTSRAQRRSNAALENGSAVMVPSTTRAPCSRSLDSAGALMSTQCVPSSHRRGTPGATSSRTHGPRDAELTSGPGVKRCGSTSRAPIQSGFRKPAVRFGRARHRYVRAAAPGSSRRDIPSQRSPRVAAYLRSPPAEGGRPPRS